MIKTLTKISLISGFLILFYSCNAVKRVGEDDFLLTENEIYVDSVRVKDEKVMSQLVQRPNSKVFGIPFGIFIYNIANPTPDSTFQKWLHKNPKREQRLVNLLSGKQVDELGNSYIGINKWFERTGSEPVIIDAVRTSKSLERLKNYYSSFGWFNVEGDYRIVPNEKKEKRAIVEYSLNLHKPYIIDSITTQISSPVVDSLFRLSAQNSFIEQGKQFANNDFNNERDRLTIQFRNSGLYYFDQDYITFEADTVNTDHKANITYIIPDRRIRIEDSTHTEPFKVHNINEVRVVTDYTFENRNRTLSDSVIYEGYKIYSYDPQKFRPKAITDAISITPNSIFKDIDRTLTYNQISDLRIFKYPNINYLEDPADSTGTGLIASILLTPREKYSWQIDFDVIPIPSPIQQFGLGFSSTFLIRNVFRGAETLGISARGSVGSSKDAADSESTFFNISDVGADAKLTFPRILFPINTEGFIEKYMSPSTSVSLGINAQNNIGLDRQNFNGIFDYRWRPSNIKTYTFELANVQYVRNLNTNNYFNVYRNSFDILNEVARDIENTNLGSIDPDYYTTDENGTLTLNLPDGADNFISDIDNGNINTTPDNTVTVNNISERKDRLTENNLIFATSFQWLRDTRENIFDNNFSRFRWKVETAGNMLSGISKLAGIEQNEAGQFRTFGVAFSQYLKLESDYIKHWDLKNGNIFAIRAFAGIAIPYGNSNSIPFTRSYFAGGANDNRGWGPYDLGPGSSGSADEFNEANFKIALNAEYRYTILGDFKGAFFIDAGNIWNAFDNVEDEASRFTDLGDLSELAIASGLGLRYDFSFFVLRFDGGFKTYNPQRPEGERWFKEYNFANIVYNIGINYPF
ncbi:MAG: BamA/TamA family outer membrane protein [Bacteroidia bacterium]|nr:BamA/TamA family outer membrane protein [Bacteroidia bacterium]MBT8276219.1 BamA/TamA family outer membrane protein [Bacteroidia bacterium]NNF31790.1 BamA/TamA family outer membrane protein [Flavobacteriaceae bacterium]NNK53371.1 BamA/TamA family outer membrane protein [Flavobacteriaceae bacterium]NNM07884.1 BamA/TamA family outer membrane protein [Flavobacteriaceae bacterium]